MCWENILKKSDCLCTWSVELLTDARRWYLWVNDKDITKIS